MEHIPIFDGGTMDFTTWPTCGHFIAIIDEFAKKEGFSEHEIQSLVRSKLSHKALEIFITNFTKSWEDQKKLLKETFSSKLTIKDKIEVRKNLQQNTNESVEDFYNRCIHAQYLVSDDDRDAGFNREVLLHFLMGLVPCIRDQVLVNSNNSCPEDFVLEAKKLYKMVKNEPVDHHEPDIKVEEDMEAGIENGHLDEEDHYLENVNYDNEESTPLLKDDRYPKSFSSKKKLKIHNQKKHSKKSSTKKPTSTESNESDLKCNYCPDMFESLQQKKEHEASIHESLSKSCNICKEEFPTFQLLAVHIAKCHCKTNSKGKLVCSICHTFQRKAIFQVRYHILADHFNCPRHKCKICGRPFEELNVLQRHVKTAHLGENPFQCDKCEKTFKTRAGLKDHSVVNHQDQKNLKCDSCDKTFSNEVHLRKHYLGQHKNEESNSVVCPDCGKFFKSKSSYAAHQLTAHASSEEKEKHKLECHHPGCSFSSLIKDNVNKHYRKVHMKVKNHLCEHCPKSFYSKLSLEEHTNGVHLNKKSYKCDLCNFATAYHSKKQEHKKVAHGTQRFDCPHCSHSATYAGNLRKHIQTMHKNIL